MAQGKRAFTLIELLIVVAIIAILALIAVPNFLEAQVRAKVSKAMNNMRTLGVALEAFHVDHNCYPPNWSTGDYPSYVQDYNDPLWAPQRGGPEDYPRASLTTPIAYITTYVGDPFMEARAYVALDGVVQDYAWQYGVDRSMAKAWVLESFGPDRTTSAPHAGGSSPTTVRYDTFLALYERQGPGITGEAFYAGTSSGGLDWPGAYDPTNGTVSRGDIPRLSYVSK